MAGTCEPCFSKACFQTGRLVCGALLCNIIGRLPFKGILAATGVCREWRAALLGDPNIREGLFLKPAEVQFVLAHNNYIREIERSIFLDMCHISGHPSPLLGSIFDRIRYAMEGFSYHPSYQRVVATPNSRVGGMRLCSSKRLLSLFT